MLGVFGLQQGGSQDRVLIAHFQVDIRGNDLFGTGMQRESSGVSWFQASLQNAVVGKL
jgi:hypothetical protein